MESIDNFVEKLDNSGAGACDYNESGINMDTGFGDGCSDEIISNKGSGSINIIAFVRKRDKVSLIMAIVWLIWLFVQYKYFK